MIVLLEPPKEAPPNGRQWATRENTANAPAPKEDPQPTPEEIKAKYPNLIPLEESTRRVTATGAKNVKIELKAAFPKTKFSVSSSVYAGGSSIDVRWMDGPTTAEVELIIDRYQDGDFDGMTDSYDYRKGSVFRDVFGCAKYVHSSRDVTDALILKWFEVHAPGTPIPEKNTNEWDEARRQTRRLSEESLNRK